MFAHPVFNQKLKNLKSNVLARLANKFLSVGGTSYYLHDHAYATKVVLFNYFSLLANRDFHAEWTIDFYSNDGKKIFSREGTFRKQELAVVDTKDLDIQSPYGVVVAHIKPCEDATILGKIYDSVFFTEHYSLHGPHHDIAHSLRWPTPVRHLYQISGHGFSFLPDAKPFVLIGNSYNRKFDFPKFYSRPTVEAINAQGTVKKITVPPIPALGCYRVDLLEHIPDLRGHFKDQAGMIRVTGENVFRKPFFYQSNGKFIASDHL